jgi:uncharacterized membrane protein YbaN (DUF454 family)
MNADLDLNGFLENEASGRSAHFSEAEGLLVVRDRRLFRPGFEGFCRRLADSAVGLGGVRSAFVCLGAGTCRLEFEAGRFNPSEMAEWFAEAVRAASVPGQGGDSPEQGGWVSLMVFSVEQGGATWESTLEDRGRFRLRQPGILDPRARTQNLARELAEIPGVASSRVTFWGGELEVRFDREGICPSEALKLADRTYRRATAPVPEPIEAAIPEVATGLQRLGYLALAAGSFVLTGVGLIVPGVPTIPFLLATSYFLVRSSPALNDRLLRSKFVGPILTDLEIRHGLGWINKLKLVGLTLTVGLVTLIVIAPTWPILLVMLTVMSASLYAISQIPGIAIESEPAQPPRLRLVIA